MTCDTPPQPSHRQAKIGLAGPTVVQLAPEADWVRPARVTGILNIVAGTSFLNRERGEGTLGLGWP